MFNLWLIFVRLYYFPLFLNHFISDRWPFWYMLQILNILFITIGIRKNEFEPVTKTANIITITSRKGGVGKTAITSLLARYLTEIEGKKVLAVHLDDRGDVASILNKDKLSNGHASIAELLLVAEQEDSVQDTYDQVVIYADLEKSKNWNNNGGRLYLIPTKPAQDSILPETNPSLL